MSSSEPHHIVAIGASAGGLEELITFFDNTSLDGVSYVIVQHLSPDYKSRMAELLSNHSKLSMQEAEDGMPLEVNFVYLVPSDQFISVKRGKLRLTEKAGIRIPHMTINTFFTSLAGDYGAKAIGVVLSGLGSDGSDGVKAIKKAGGMVVVRNPETAEFTSMPSNAVATGMADFIVEPEAMPLVIEEYIKRELDLIAAGINDTNNMVEFVELINQQLPFDFSDYKPTTILRRIKRRAAYNNFEKLEEYLVFARSNPSEIETLAKDFLISVTAFFRDPEAFGTLRSQILPKIIDGLYPGQEIRIWVAGCATGEEAYSMAIMVSELLGDSIGQYDVKILSTDIDAAALAHAGRGVYSANVVTSIPAGLLEKHFVQIGENFQIRPAIRKMVIFAQHDLVKNPPYCNLHLISCRNLLIYMTPTLQKKVYMMLLFGLKKDGYLFLGSSESPLPILRSLEVVDKKSRIYKNVEPSHTVNFEAFSLPESLYKKPAYSGLVKDELPKRNDKTLADAVNETIFAESQDLIVCIDEAGRVVKSYGDTTRFLYQKIFTIDLNELLPAPLAVSFKTLINKVEQTRQKATVSGIMVPQGNTFLKASLTVRPMTFKGRHNGFFVVQFSEEKEDAELSTDTMVFDENLYLDEYTKSLEQENKELREQLLASNESLTAIHENMQSFNEELLSANEEMQSTNEEMQSINEELQTINSDYQLKNKELLELNDDLNNYFRSNTNGQLFVNRDLQLMKFSPGTVKLINLLESDIGRPITDISTNFRLETITADVRQVISDGETITREVQANDGHWYQVMTMPYIQQISNSRTGAVISFNDITNLKNAQQLLNKKNETLTRINVELDKILNVASHDLMQPLEKITAALGLFNKSQTSEDDLKYLLDDFGESVKNFQMLVREFSTLPKTED